VTKNYLALATVALGLTNLLGGCRSAPTPVSYARAFPTDITQKEVLNIQVFRRTTTLEFTNTTAKAFGPSTLWLNMWYSRPIKGLAVGESVSLPLADFRDRYSAKFRGGGFFASEPPEKLVLAQIETARADAPAELAGLIVVVSE